MKNIQHVILIIGIVCCAILLFGFYNHHYNIVVCLNTIVTIVLIYAIRLAIDQGRNGCALVSIILAIIFQPIIDDPEFSLSRWSWIIIDLITIYVLGNMLFNSEYVGVFCIYKDDEYGYKQTIGCKISAADKLKYGVYGYRYESWTKKDDMFADLPILFCHRFSKKLYMALHIMWGEITNFYIYDAGNLIHITIPDTVKIIDGILGDSPVKSIIIPNSVNQINK